MSGFLPTISNKHPDDDQVSPAISNERLRQQVTEACQAWLMKSPSQATRENYFRDLQQFISFIGMPHDQLERLLQVLPRQVSAWRDHLASEGLTNNSIRRKLTVLRSLYSYLQVYGYTGVNPAHSNYVEAPAAPRDGKTVGFSPQECRRLLDAPNTSHPVGVRDRALLAVLAYTGCRVGELCRIRVGDFKTSSGHRFFEIRGKGGKERRIPLHPEAVERIEAWLDAAGIRSDPEGAIFRPPISARGNGKKGFKPQGLSKRAVQFLVERFVLKLKLDPSVTVHSFRVTALTTARERGSDIVDLQDFAGHSDPRTTLTYIRNRDRLSNSPAYVLRY